MAKNYRNFILAGLSGLLLALAYPSWSFNFGFLVWVGLVPIFYLKDKINFKIGFTAGLIYFAIVFRWFWAFYPLDAVGINDKPLSFLIILFFYSVSVGAMACFWGLFGFIFKKHSGGKLRLDFLLAPAIFTLIELGQAYGFGLLWLGSGSLIGPHWTMGNLGYTLYNNGFFLKLASYAGIYGLTFLIGLVNYFFAQTIILKNRKYIYASGLLFVFITGSYFFTFKNSSQDSKKITYAIIQTNIPTKISYAPREKLANFQEQLSLLNQVARERPETDLIVFPEATDFFKDLSVFLKGVQIENYFTSLFKNSRLILSGTRIIEKDGRAYSRIFALDTRKAIVGYYDKRLLTPAGEFLPYPIKFIANIFLKNKISQFGEYRELAIGKNKASIINFNNQYKLATLVCSEVLSPDLARLSALNSDIMVSMTSTAIFHGSNTPIRELLAISQLRAAENQKPLIMAANMGLSYAIDSLGNISQISKNQGSQMLTGAIVLNSKRSWYNKLGDWPILLVSGFVIGITFNWKKYVPKA